MSHDVYYEFQQSPEQKRRLSGRGGKATARHRRERLQHACSSGPEPQLAQFVEIHLESTAAAIATLDVQFPWLRGAEKRSRKGFVNRTLETKRRKHS